MSVDTGCILRCNLFRNKFILFMVVIVNLGANKKLYTILLAVLVQLFGPVV